MLFSLFLFAGAIATGASAQSTSMLVTSAMASTMASVPPAGATSYPINIGAIPLGTKAGWCTGQQNSCIDLCKPQGPQINNCTAATLEYECTCSSGTTPNLVNYNFTIPFYECQWYIGVCVNSTNNAEVQRQCLSRQCGGANPADFVASTSTTLSSSSTSTASPTTSPSSHNAGHIMTSASKYGLGAFVGGIAAIGLVL